MEFALRRWNGLDVRGRVLVAILTFVAIVATAIAFALQRDARVALFAAPLRSEQVEEVAERLAEWDVPFVITTDNVRVDGGARNGLLLKLAMLGIPHAHLTSLDDALAKAGALTPQSVLDTQALDGRAGDLASGLRGVGGVEDARVIIAPAREGTFADDGAAHAATASVRLTLRPGTELSRATVDGLRAYVADGVPGLAPEHVAILDDRGLTFSEASNDASEGSALQTSLQSALDQALGPGATVVRVRVTLDARTTRHREVVRQPFAAAIGTTVSAEHFKSSTKQYAKSNATVDRGSDVRDENVDTPPGRIERISVAVAVDAARKFDLAKIESLARATLALDAARGDVVSVTSVPFPRRSVPSRALPFVSLFDSIAGMVPSTLVALALLAAIRYGAKPFLHVCEAFAERIAVERTSRAVSGFAPAHVRGALADEPPHTAAAIISALPAATATAVLEMYSAEERAAIVRRMARAAAPAVPDHETVLRRA